MNGIPVSLSRDELLDCIVAFKEGREIPVPPDGWSTQKLLEVAGAANFVAMLQVRGELQQEIGDLADNEETKQDAAWNAGGSGRSGPKNRVTGLRTRRVASRRGATRLRPRVESREASPDRTARRLAIHARSLGGQPSIGGSDCFSCD